MSKKWTANVGAVALVAVALASALLLVSCKKNAPTSSSTGLTSSTTSSTGATTASGTAGAGTGLTQTQTMTTSPTGTGSSTSTSTQGGSSSTGTKAAPAVGPLKPFPPLPDSGIRAQAITQPLKKGAKLPPLTEAPGSTISGLKATALPNGAQYAVVVRPLGIGPSSPFGSRIVLRVDSIKPVGKTPVPAHLANANVLVLADTTHGGAITKGGTYTATLTFISDGTKLVPVLSNVKAQ